jgi:hypothetical protein
MVLIIFSNRRVCCGNALIPAPTIMQSNFSLESVSETTLSAVSKINEAALHLVS